MGRATIAKRKTTTSRRREEPAGAADELQEVWRAFKEEESPDARERLILHYSPLVKFVAGRLAAGLPQNVEQADLVSFGMFGLIDALDRFDLAREVKFETYAIPRIKGAIIDELRALDWVPRSVRFKARELDKAYQHLEAKLGRPPTDPEVAKHLGFSLQELHEVITQISFVSVMALDDTIGGGERGEQRTLLDTLADAGSADPTADLEGQEMRTILSTAISDLGEREKVVVTLYYFEGLTLAEIGDILGVTESRICQIHTKAVSNLRKGLSDRGV